MRYKITNLYSDELIDLSPLFLHVNVEKALRTVLLGMKQSLLVVHIRLIDSDTTIVVDQRKLGATSSDKRSVVTQLRLYCHLKQRRKVCFFNKEMKKNREQSNKDGSKGSDPLASREINFGFQYNACNVCTITTLSIYKYDMNGERDFYGLIFI